MKKRFVGIFLCIFLFYTTISFAQIQGITISDTDFVCGEIGTEPDGICPSDYAGCQACTTDGTTPADDPDCCSPVYCSFSCTIAGVVCGDVATETFLDEIDSGGENADSSTAEDCSGVCDPSTEEVIDESNDPGCYDESRYPPGSCADDGLIYDPYTVTDTECVEGVSCHDTEGDGDSEVCDNSGWHDPDEDKMYCDASTGTWIEAGTESGTDSFEDDYDGNLGTGYCDGDDGYVLQGAVVQETYRGSETCEAAVDVTITIKDINDQIIIYYTTTTRSSTSWSEYSYDLPECLERSSEAGQYTLSLPAGTYYLVAEKEGYNTHTETITVTGTESDIAPITLYLNADCQSDCTRNDNICDAECEGINGCTYNVDTDNDGIVDMDIAPYCDGQQQGSRYELSSTDTGYGETGIEIYCCTGPVNSYTRTAMQSLTSNCVENIIAREKSFIVNGEPLTLHFVVFSDPKPEKPGCEIYEDFMCEMYGGGFCQ